jgi:hypothetical protein
MCSPLSAQGGTIEEDDACTMLGGPSQFLRSESGGSAGSYVWTYATSEAQPTSFAAWSIALDTAGLYRVEAYVSGASDNSQEAKYRITHLGGVDEVFADQSTASGFIELGMFNFMSGGGYSVRLDDNTGEDASLMRRLIFDAVRLTPLDAPPCPTITLAPGVDALNIRPRPNTTLPAIGQIAAGQLIQRLATVSGELVSGNAAWHRIQSGQIIGYVAGGYTACTP